MVGDVVVSTICERCHYCTCIICSSPYGTIDCCLRPSRFTVQSLTQIRQVGEGYISRLQCHHHSLCSTNIECPEICISHDGCVLFPGLAAAVWGYRSLSRDELNSLTVPEFHKVVHEPSCSPRYLLSALDSYTFLQCGQHNKYLSNGKAGKRTSKLGWTHQQ